MCLGFDPWETGQSELKINLMTEQTKVGDLLFMKYKIQKPIFELAIDETMLRDDQDVKDFMKKQEEAMIKARIEHEKKYELSDD